ncbi:MAG: hypothetical protein Q8J69_09790 [Sphingobacteriaceae bacterium]|nr:hypothetical protein [Sphingobacteriaceae bacterium]
MIAALFQSNRLLLAYAAGLALTLAILAMHFLGISPLTPPLGSQWLMELLLQLPLWALYILNLISIMGSAVVFNQLIIGEKVSREYNSLFFFAYLLAAFSYWPWTEIQPALYTSFLFLFIIRNMMIAGNSRKQLSLVFDAGWLGGLSFLLYQPAWVLLPVSLLSIALGGIFRFKALILWFFGYITPLYLLAALAYLSNQTDLLAPLFYVDTIDFASVHFLSTGDKTLLAFGMTIFAMGVAISFTGGNLKTNALRNAQRIFFILLICGILSVFFLPGDGWQNASIYIPVAAFYMGRFLEAIQKNWLFNLLILSWLGLLLWSSGIF